MLEKIEMGCWGLFSGWGISPTYNDAKEVIEYAINNGIRIFDSAKIYSEFSERIFKEFHNYDIIVNTKIPAITKPLQTELDANIEAFYDIEYISKSIESSINNLLTIDTIYLHNRSTYWNTELITGILTTLKIYKDRNYISNIGVSLPDNYSGDITTICNNDIINCIQINQNSINNNISIIKELQNSGKEVRIRGILQQGLLLKNINYSVIDPRRKKHQYLTETKKTSLLSCLQHAFETNADKIIIGLRTKQQIDDLLLTIYEIEGKK